MCRRAIKDLSEEEVDDDHRRCANEMIVNVSSERIHLQDGRGVALLMEDVVLRAFMFLCNGQREFATVVSGCGPRTERVRGMMIPFCWFHKRTDKNHHATSSMDYGLQEYRSDSLSSQNGLNGSLLPRFSMITRILFPAPCRTAYSHESTFFYRGQRMPNVSTTCDTDRKQWRDIQS